MSVSAMRVSPTLPMIQEYAAQPERFVLELVIAVVLRTWLVLMRDPPVAFRIRVRLHRDARAAEHVHRRFVKASFAVVGSADGNRRLQMS